MRGGVWRLWPVVSALGLVPCRGSGKRPSTQVQGPRDATTPDSPLGNGYCASPSHDSCVHFRTRGPHGPTGNRDPPRHLTADRALHWHARTLMHHSLCVCVTVCSPGRIRCAGLPADRDNNTVNSKYMPRETVITWPYLGAATRRCRWACTGRRGGAPRRRRRTRRGGGGGGARRG